MQLYCPTCKSSVPAAERCPRCNDRLCSPSEIASIPRDAPVEQPPPLRPTPLGRVTVATVAALGLYLGLREALLGGVLAIAPSESGPALALNLNWSLRAFAVLVGGLLAGAGRPYGAWTGLATGTLCGALFLLADHAMGVRLTQADWSATTAIALSAVPLGMLGARVWSPAAELPTTTSGSRGSSLAHLIQKEDRQEKVRPTAWFQIAWTTAMAGSAFVLADGFRQVLRAYAPGLNIGTVAQVPNVDFVFAGLAVLVGGLLAAAGTGAGLRHGALMGAATALVVTAISLVSPEAVEVPLQGLYAFWGNPEESPRSPNGSLVLFGALTAMGLLAGGFGGLLLPRLAVASRRVRQPD